MLWCHRNRCYYLKLITHMLLKYPLRIRLVDVRFSAWVCQSRIWPWITIIGCFVLFHCYFPSILWKAIGSILESPKHYLGFSGNSEASILRSCHTINSDVVHDIMCATQPLETMANTKIYGKTTEGDTKEVQITPCHVNVSFPPVQRFAARANPS